MNLKFNIFQQNKTTKQTTNIFQQNFPTEQRMG